MAYFGLTVVSRGSTEDAGYPLNLALCKKHLRIIGRDADNTILQHYLNGAIEYVEHLTNRCFINTVYDMSLKTFPLYLFQPIQPQLIGRAGITFPKAPVVSVTSVKYKDFDGVEQTFATWELNNKFTPAVIIPEKTAVWPYADVQRANAVTIRFTAGYGVALPYRVIDAVLGLVEHRYFYRGTFIDFDPKMLPFGLRSLIGTLKVYNASQ